MPNITILRYRPLHVLLLASLFACLGLMSRSNPWLPVDDPSVWSRRVGNLSNEKCCRNAQYIPCNPCLTNPNCTGTAQSYCANAAGESTTQAECVTQPDLYCTTSNLVAVNVPLATCTLAGRSQQCTGDPNKVFCVVIDITNTSMTYKKCPSGTVDICNPAPPLCNPTS
jgi:hypothetical protein